MDGGLNGERPWQAQDPARNYLSSSLLNARKYPHGLYTSQTALVISPRSRLLCSYPQDSGTKSFVRFHGCGPKLCGKADAPFPKPFRDRGYPCAFPPDMFADMLTVFDNATVEESACKPPPLSCELNTRTELGLTPKFTKACSRTSDHSLA